MIQEAIFSRLSGFAGLSALVALRIYYRLMPENPSYPALSYFKVSETRVPAMGVDAGVVHARFQFDVWDIDQDSVRDVTEQLRQALERYRGTFVVSSQTKQWFDSFIDDVQEPQADLVDAVPVWHSITDVMIHYQD